MHSEDPTPTISWARRAEARGDLARAAQLYAELAGHSIASRRQALRALQTAAAQRAVDAWNEIRPIGTPVHYWPGGDEQHREGVTLSRAHLSDAGVPVVFVSCATGYVALTHVRWAWQPRCCLCGGPSAREGFRWQRCSCTPEARCATCTARAGAIGVAASGPSLGSGHGPNCPACVERTPEGISCRALCGTNAFVEEAPHPPFVRTLRCTHPTVASALACAKDGRAGIGGFQLAAAMQGDAVLRAAVAVSKVTAHGRTISYRAGWREIPVVDGRYAPPAAYRQDFIAEMGAACVAEETAPELSQESAHA